MQLTSAQRSALWLIRLWIALAVAWVGYGWITYTGLFRWVSRLQVERMGEYSDKLSFLASVVLLIVPAGLLGRVYGVNKMIMGQRDRGPASPFVAARVMAGLAAVSLIVAAGALGWALLPHAPPSVGQVDLTVGGALPPETDRVTVTGVERPRLASILVSTINGSARRTTYTPLTAPAWRQGEPIAWFVATEGDRIAHLNPDGSPLASGGATRIDNGIVSRNALPGLLLDDYQRNGVRLADPYWVVSYPDDLSASETAYIVAALAAVFSFFFAIAALLMWWRARRRLSRAT